MDTKLKELIDETEILKETLEKLNNEINSYKTAKESLDSVKNKLTEVSDSNLEIVFSLKEYLEKINEALNEEFVDSVKNTENNVKSLLIKIDSIKDNIIESINVKSSNINNEISKYSKIIIGFNVLLSLLVIYLTFIK